MFQKAITKRKENQEFLEEEKSECEREKEGAEKQDEKESR